MAIIYIRGTSQRSRIHVADSETTEVNCKARLGSVVTSAKLAKLLRKDEQGRSLMLLCHGCTSA